MTSASLSVFSSSTKHTFAGFDEIVQPLHDLLDGSSPVPPVHVSRRQLLVPSAADDLQNTSI